MTLREIQDEIERKVMPRKCGKAYLLLMKQISRRLNLASFSLLVKCESFRAF